MEAVSDPDFALVRACQEDGAARWDDAFRALHDRHARTVLRTCLRVTGDVNDALDAAQEAFLLAFRGIRSFRFDARFSRWLCRIALRVSFEHLRNRRPTRRFSDLPEDELAALRRPGPRADPRAAAELRERRVRVRRALRRLSPHLRQILSRRYFEDLSHEELARQLAIAGGSVKSRLHRAHAALNVLLDAHQGDL